MLNSIYIRAERQIGRTDHFAEVARHSAARNGAVIPLHNSSSVGLILDIYQCSIPPTAQIKLSDEHIAYRWFQPAEAAELLRVKYSADFCDVIAVL